MKEIFSGILQRLFGSAEMNRPCKSGDSARAIQDRVDWAGKNDNKEELWLIGTRQETSLNEFVKAFKEIALAKLWILQGRFWDWFGWAGKNDIKDE